MYGPVGFRPATIQHIKLGSSKDGKLQAVSHESVNENCTFFDFVESVSDGARFLYACPNAYTSEKVAALDIGQPTWMRAPGHAPGSFALESAMDELAYALNLDPVELRVRNFAERDLDKNLPYSGNSLLECYKRGAETFGWHKRDPKPRSMKEGRLLVGWGMATALHSVWRNTASVNVELLDDGSALVQSGSQDIGTGTYTIMTQIAADKLSLPFGRVNFELGDSNFPLAPVSGGSTTSGSVGGAVAQACSAALDKLIQTARKDAKSPLFGAKVEDIDTADGVLSLKSDRSKSESYQSIVARTSQKKIQIKLETELDKNQEKYSMNTFGAQFAEVKVDPDLGSIQVSRFVGAYGAGRILNAKTARSQMLGGITCGVGMALLEHTMMDHRYGRILSADLAEYHIPVHHDIAEIDVSFIEEEDPLVNVIGAKGVGELGITGVAAAIANAVYHATGKRVRDLPITLDKLL
jgi:xanthine dehydrogenase YagR molybdenum-binding subunit